MLNIVDSIDGEYVPHEHDRVEYRRVAVPPKNNKFQAVHVRLVDIDTDTRETWNDSNEYSTSW